MTPEILENLDDRDLAIITHAVEIYLDSQMDLVDLGMDVENDYQERAEELMGWLRTVYEDRGLNWNLYHRRFTNDDVGSNSD